ASISRRQSRCEAAGPSSRRGTTSCPRRCVLRCRTRIARWMTPSSRQTSWRDGLGGMEMTKLDEQAAYTRQKLDELRDALRRHLGDDADRILRDDTCIYVVGSGGRGE